MREPMCTVGISDDDDGTHVVAHRIDIDAADVVPVVLPESLLIPDQSVSLILVMAD